MSRPFTWPSPYDVLAPCDFVLPGQSPPAEPPSFPPRPTPNKPPRRRGLLGAVAALTLVPAMTNAAPIADPDAELIRSCARYLELERIMEDPAHPGHALDCDKLPEWSEFLAVRSAIYAATPQTLEGMAAVARVALLCSRGDHLDHWDDDDAQRLANKLLQQLVGPGLAAEIETMKAERAAARAIVSARYAAGGDA